MEQHPFQIFSPILGSVHSHPIIVPTQDVQSSGAKPKTKKRIKACVNCSRSHIACELGTNLDQITQARPCHRCIEKGIETTCVDNPKKKRKKESENTNEPVEPLSSSPLTPSPIVNVSPATTMVKFHYSFTKSANTSYTRFNNKSFTRLSIRTNC